MSLTLSDGNSTLRKLNTLFIYHTLKEKRKHSTLRFNFFFFLDNSELILGIQVWSYYPSEALFKDVYL